MHTKTQPISQQTEHLEDKNLTYHFILLKIKKHDICEYR